MTHTEANDVTYRTLNFLIWKATHGQTTTYGEVQENAGFPQEPHMLASMQVSTSLSTIFEWCMSHNWPCLTSLVARGGGQDEGLPSKAFWELVDMHHSYEDFYCEGRLSLAPKSVRLAYLKYLQQRCFNYFSGLKSKVTPYVEQGSSTRLITTSPAQLPAIIKTSFCQIPGFDELQHEDQDKIVQHCFDEDGTLKDELVVDMQRYVTEDENFINGKHRRAWESVLHILQQRQPVSEFMATDTMRILSSLEGWDDLNVRYQAAIVDYCTARRDSAGVATELKEQVKVILEKRQNNSVPSKAILMAAQVRGIRL